jgi:CRISPR-associated endonuclease/helicase Cas3
MLLARPEQSLEEHLRNVSQNTKLFLSDTPYSQLGEVSGLTHDAGKQPSEWQKYLLGSSEQKMDHTSLGAQICYQKYGTQLGKILAYVVAGHHAGLHNEEDLQRRLEKDVGETVVSGLPEKIDFQPPKKATTFSPQFLIRMLFSALVDADCLDAERATSGYVRGVRQEKPKSLAQIKQQFSNKMQEMQENASKTLVNKIRREMLEDCISAAKMPSGFFSLTMPTGGGKTLSSCEFGLSHAENNGQDRIIYVIPFLTISEQNAAVLKDFAGKNAVLEHHSNFDFSEDLRSSLAADNWDYPIIVTTMVQFFDSLFSNKTSKCRKLHNIKNSVIILDEAQSIRLKYLKPCIAVLKELVDNYNCSVVFCTATQPAISKRKYFDFGIENITEIIQNPKKHFEFLRRTQVQFLGNLTNKELCDRILLSQKSTLVIVNTKKEATTIYRQIEFNNKYILTTNLCPKHRREKLAKIRQDLAANKRCIVISTSLIEAGVDISFPVVFRAINGLDAIIQGAGRCNREGELENFGQVFIYIPEEGLPFGDMKIAAQTTKTVMYKHKDIDTLDAIDEYFRDLYYQSNLDTKEIYHRLTCGVKNLSFPFKDIGRDFSFLDDEKTSLIVPYNSYARNFISSLEKYGPSRNLSRKLQQYAIQVRPKDVPNLPVEQKPKGGPFVLVDPNAYKENIGLDLNYECEPLIV